MFRLSGRLSRLMGISTTAQRRGLPPSSNLGASLETEDAVRDPSRTALGYGVRSCLPGPWTPPCDSTSLDGRRWTFVKRGIGPNGSSDFGTLPRGPSDFSPTRLIFADGLEACRGPSPITGRSASVDRVFGGAFRGETLA